MIEKLVEKISCLFLDVVQQNILEPDFYTLCKEILPEDAKLHVLWNGITEKYDFLNGIISHYAENHLNFASLHWRIQNVVSRLLLVLPIYYQYLLLVKYFGIFTLFYFSKFLLQFASKCLTHTKDVTLTMSMKLQDRNNEHQHVFHIDSPNLLRITDILETALAETKSSHVKRELTVV